MLVGLDEATGVLACSIIERILIKDNLKLFKVNWNRVLSNDDSWIVFNGFNLTEPWMLTNIGCCVSFRWIGIEDLLEEVTAVIADEVRYRVISIQDLLV